MKKRSLRTRILITGAATIVLVVGAMSFINFRRSGSNLLQMRMSHARSLLLTAEAAREQASHQWTVGLIDQDVVDKMIHRDQLAEILEATPIMVALRTVQEVGREDGLEVRLSALHPRNPGNAPDPIDRKALQHLRRDALDEYTVIEGNELRYYRPVKITRECLMCHGNPRDSQRYWHNDQGTDPSGTPMEDLHEGEIHGAMVVVESLAPDKAALRLALFKNLMLGGVLALLGIGTMLWLIDRSGLRPLERSAARIAGSASRLNDSSAEVAASGQVLAENASNQAANLQEVTAELQEMASQVTTNTQRVADARQVAAEAVTTTREGFTSVNEMSSAMSEIKSAADHTETIIKTIDELAFQTNLLALNAAVEAARAGEAGRGFAVVADEVRKLAQDSTEAVKESARLLEEVRVKTDNGVASTRAVERALEGIGAVIERIDSVLQEVATTGREQSEGINQISTTIQQIDQLTQGNAATAQQAAAAAEILAEQAKELNNIVCELSGILGRDSVETTSSPMTKTGARPRRGERSEPRAKLQSAPSVGKTPEPAGKHEPPQWDPAGHTETSAGTAPAADDSLDDVFHLEEEDLIEI